MSLGHVQELIARGQALGQSNISEDSSAAVRRDAAFLELREHVFKLDAAGSGQSVELYSQIETLATDLLRRSADILAASYLCFALFRRDGYQGLVSGLSCVVTVRKAAQESVNKGELPRDKENHRQRIALEWLGERLKKRLKSTISPPLDFELIRACRDVLGRLDLDGSGIDSPQWRDLSALWTSVGKQLDSIAQDVHTPPVGVRSNADSPPEKPSSATAIESSVDLKSAWRPILEAALRTRRQDSAAVWPYKVLRLAEWSELNYPPHSDYRTPISDPVPGTVKRLRDAQAGPAWVDLLDDAETEFQNSPLWLDLHRFSYSALLRLGDQYLPAAQGIQAEVASLLQRLPDLIHFKFNNGTAFADGETISWVAQSSVSSRAPGEEDEAGEREQNNDSAESASQRLGRSSSLRKAAQCFQTELKRMTSGSEIFRFRLEFARLCERRGEWKMAGAQLTLLEEQATHHGLDTWEPGLYSEMLEYWWRFVSKNKGQKITAEVAQLADQIYTRLSKVNPAKALGLDRKRKVGVEGG